MHKDKKLDIRQSRREANAISYIKTALRGHNPELYECCHTGKYYLLLPQNMLQGSRKATCSLGEKGVKVKLVCKNNKIYTKIACCDLLQLEGIVKKIRDKK